MEGLLICRDFQNDAHSMEFHDDAPKKARNINLKRNINYQKEFIGSGYVHFRHKLCLIIYDSKMSQISLPINS